MEIDSVTKENMIEQKLKEYKAGYYNFYLMSVAFGAMDEKKKANEAKREMEKMEKAYEALEALKDADR